MTKKILIILIFVCFSCKTSQFNINIYSRIASRGYNGLSYGFSDMGSRNLKIKFLNDSTLKVSNRTDISQNFYFSNFEMIYSYKPLKMGEIIVKELIQSDKKIEMEEGYLKPYENDPSFDQKAQHLFPNIVGDTIRFSSDFKRLQIREFNFSIQ